MFIDVYSCVAASVIMSPCFLYNVHSNLTCLLSKLCPEWLSIGFRGRAPDSCIELGDASGQLIHVRYRVLLQCTLAFVRVQRYLLIVILVFIAGLLMFGNVC